MQNFKFFLAIILLLTLGEYNFLFVQKAQANSVLPSQTKIGKIIGPVRIGLQLKRKIVAQRKKRMEYLKGLPKGLSFNSKNATYHFLPTVVAVSKETYLRLLDEFKKDTLKANLNLVQQQGDFHFIELKLNKVLNKEIDKNAFILLNEKNMRFFPTAIHSESQALGLLNGQIEIKLHLKPDSTPLTPPQNLSSPYSLKYLGYFSGINKAYFYAENWEKLLKSEGNFDEKALALLNKIRSDEKVVEATFSITENFMRPL